MPGPVISIELLSKKYRLGAVRRDTLRDHITQIFSAPFRRLGSQRPAADEEFWALQDVSFTVERGEVLGIVGRNGAGKSTLLKILSRITEPTAGRVAIRGRVASLLEVGTGFHPELSGRENIFLNGAILGMSRGEIRRKFDEIVAFAEVERFLDTPVKHYSSGMYVRLAFAVAAHLEPEILIVDEVLAVGDVAFQKKCLGKMQTVARGEGRTVLYVSHNLQSIRQLCRSALLLNQGRVAAVGTAASVIDSYVRSLVQSSGTSSVKADPALAAQACITSVAVETLAGAAATELPVGTRWRVRVKFHVGRSYDHFVIGIGITGADGSPIQTAWHPPQPVVPGNFEAVFEQSEVTLESGHYSLIVGLSQSDHSIQQIEAASFDVTGETTNGYFPVVAGVGPVLNSMKTSLRQCAAGGRSDS